ncbi:MAG: TonB-dependent receptor [Balneolaceae bacterium]|nr:TonB-dependent receptor [Balneolaceae bacterium]
MNLSYTSKIATFLLLSVWISADAFSQTSTERDTSKVIDEIVLDRITVVGNPVWMTRIPGAASYVSAEQLKRHSYTDVNRILRTISGINIQEEDGYGLRPNIGLRGAGVERSTKVNLMEDGILVAPAPYSAPAAYYFPTMARINSVEVRKGSSQIKYGPNTTGGAINMISTPIPSEMTANAELSVGERFSNKLYANIGNRTERFGYMVEVLQLGDDGFKQLDGGGDTGFQVRDILGKFMYQNSPNASVYQRFELKVGYNTQISDETYLGVTRDDFNSAPNRRYAASQVDNIDVEQFQISARHFALLSNNVDLTSTIYRQDVTRAWYKLHDLDTSVETVNTGGLRDVLRNPEANSTELSYLRGATSPDNALNVRNNNREYYSQGIQSILGVNFETGDASHQVEFGVRLHQDQEDRFQEEDGYRMEDGVMVLTNAGVPGTQANRVGSATALSFFVQDQIRLNRWTITPGLRYEQIWFNNRNYGTEDLERTGSNLNENEYTTNVFIPGVGISFQANDNVTLIGGLHRGFSPPSPGSSSETTSELSVNYELGARYTNGLFQAEAIGFFNNYSNLLGSDLAAGGGGGTTAQFNAGRVDVLGLEFTTSMELAEILNLQNASIPFNVNYTYTNSTFQSDFESGFGPWGSVESGDKIPFIPEHQFNAGLSFNTGAFTASVNSIYSPKMRTVAGSGAIDPDFSTDSYLLFDLSSSYAINSNIDIFTNIRNLLNETYIVSDRPAGVRPGLPRTVMGGVRYSL